MMAHRTFSIDLTRSGAEVDAAIGAMFAEIEQLELDLEHPTDEGVRE